MDAVRWFPIVAPSYANVDSILATAHAKKNEERWDNSSFEARLLALEKKTPVADVASQGG